MTALHRQFAESLGKLVDEQIAATIEVRMAPVRAQLREEIRDQAGRAAGLAASAAEEQVAEKLQPVAETVTDLERRLEENDRNTLDLVLALGQLCLQTAERLSAPAMEMVAAARAEAAPAEAPSGEPGEEQTLEAEAAGEAAAADVLGAGEPEVVAPEPPVEPAPASEPGAAQADPPQRTKAPWRIPLVSSFFVATCGLLLLHYL